MLHVRLSTDCFTGLENWFARIAQMLYVSIIDQTIVSAGESESSSTLSTAIPGSFRATNGAAGLTLLPYADPSAWGPVSSQSLWA